MAKKIMIATHTILAEGLKKAADFFTGEGGGIVTVCAYEDPNADPTPEIDRFFDSLEPNDTVVVFTDLLCGSVNQIIAKKLQTREFHLITDVNLSVVIGISALSEEEINPDTIRENIELGRLNLKYMNDAMLEESTVPETESSEDFLS